MPAAGSAIMGSISTETWGLFFLGTGGSPRCNLTCGWRVESVTPATAPWKECGTRVRHIVQSTVLTRNAGPQTLTICGELMRAEKAIISPWLVLINFDAC